MLLIAEKERNAEKVELCQKRHSSKMWRKWRVFLLTCLEMCYYVSQSSISWLRPRGQCPKTGRCVFKDIYYEHFLKFLPPGHLYRIGLFRRKAICSCIREVMLKLTMDYKMTKHMLNNFTLKENRTWLLFRTWHCYFIPFNDEHPVG